MSFPYDRTAFGNAVGARRKGLGWSREDLADRATRRDEAVDAKLIEAIEEGRRRPSPELLEGLAGAFGVKVCELLSDVPLDGTRLTAGELLAAALDLDRSDQWRRLLRICQRNRDALLLRLGPAGAASRRPVDCLHRFLGGESGTHRIVRLQYPDVPPSDVAGWERLLVDGLLRSHRTPPPRGHLLGQLRKLCGRSALLVVLPIPAMAPLEGAAGEAYGDFLVRSLSPALINRGDGYPVRFLITAELPFSPAAAAARVERLEALTAAAAHRRAPRTLDYLRLGEARMPTWPEVRSWLLSRRIDGNAISAADPVVQQLRSIHRKLADEGPSSWPLRRECTALLHF